MTITVIQFNSIQRLIEEDQKEKKRKIPYDQVFSKPKIQVTLTVWDLIVE